MPPAIQCKGGLVIMFENKFSYWTERTEQIKYEFPSKSLHVQGLSKKEYDEYNELNNRYNEQTLLNSDYELNCNNIRLATEDYFGLVERRI